MLTTTTTTLNANKNLVMKKCAENVRCVTLTNAIAIELCPNGSRLNGKHFKLKKKTRALH